MPGPFDPQEFMHLLQYITSGAHQMFSPGGMDAEATRYRMLEPTMPPDTNPLSNFHVPPPGDTQVSPMQAQNAYDWMPHSLQGTAGDPRPNVGIASLNNRLSGEGNLGLLLVGQLLPVMAAQGDPSAAFLMELMRGGQGQGATTGPVSQV